MTVGAARAVAAAWVARCAAPDPSFRGAFLTGSAIALPATAPLPRTSDVDVTVVVADPFSVSPSSASPPSASPPVRAAPAGKRLVNGLLLDVTYLPERALAEPARVAASFVYAPSFRGDVGGGGGAILADPTGQLAHLEAVIAPAFASPAAIRARTADVHRRIRTRLSALDPGAAWADLVQAWLFPASLTAVAALVAALRPPTVRLRYLRAREVVPAPEYERLLALLGCADRSPGPVARHLDALAGRFDEAAAVLARTDGPSFPFAADLTSAARPVAIDGSRTLVDGGDHREAVFWIVATAARGQAVLNARAPALARERELGFRALVADLTGLRTPADVLARCAVLLSASAWPV